MYKRVISALKKDNQKTLAQMFRYGFVSVIALAIDFSTLVLATELLHLHYLISATLGFSLGIIVNYICTRLWVFEKSKYNSRTAEFGLFLFVGITGLLINNAIMWSLTSVLGILYLASKVVSTVVVFFWNFFLRKYLIYSRSTPAKN